MAKQFKDETREQQLKLFNAWLDGEEIEMLCGGEWGAAYPTWSIKVCYRIKSTADTVPWDAIHEDYQWYARDESGRTFLFTNVPYMEKTRWNTNRFIQELSGVFTGHKIGTCGWEDSLQERPKP